jgi:hypothetical protein
MEETGSETAEPSVHGRRIADLITGRIFAATSFYLVPEYADGRVPTGSADSYAFSSFSTDGFIHDTGLHCFLEPIAPSLPKAENRDHFWRLNFIQKLGDWLQQLFWLVEGLADKQSLHMTAKPEVRWCEIKTVRWVRHTSNMVFSDKLLSGL